MINSTLGTGRCEPEYHGSDMESDMASGYFCHYSDIFLGRQVLKMVLTLKGILVAEHFDVCSNASPWVPLEGDVGDQGEWICLASHCRD